MIVHACYTSVRSRFDPTDHREVAHLRSRGERARNPNSKRRALRVGRAAEPAEPAIHARGALSLRSGMRGRQRRKRRLGPVDADRFAAFRKQFAGGIQLMRAIGVTRSLRSPGIGQRPGDVDLPLGNSVIAPHLLPGDRPIRAVAERRARLEPLGSEAQRHHRVMDGRSAYRLARIVAAHLDRVWAVEDALVGPVKLVLRGFVRCKILQRAEKAACIEGDDREALLSQQCGERSSACAGADDDEIDGFALSILPHRNPSRPPGKYRGRCRCVARG